MRSPRLCLKLKASLAVLIRPSGKRLTLLPNAGCDQGDVERCRVGSRVHCTWRGLGNSDWRALTWGGSVKVSVAMLAFTALAVRASLTRSTCGASVWLVLANP